MEVMAEESCDLGDRGGIFPKRKLKGTPMLETSEMGLNAEGHIWAPSCKVPPPTSFIPRTQAYGKTLLTWQAAANGHSPVPFSKEVKLLGLTTADPIVFTLASPPLCRQEQGLSTGLPRQGLALSVTHSQFLFFHSLEIPRLSVKVRSFGPS